MHYWEMAFDTACAKQIKLILIILWCSVLVSPHSIHNIGNELAQEGWSQWSHWSICFAKCDFGVRVRTRQCVVRDYQLLEIVCEGSRIEIKPCASAPCTSPMPVETTAMEETTAMMQMTCPWLHDSSASSCGRNAFVASRVKKILGGETSQPHAWPWQVALWSNGELVCGATLIGQGWVLTAAHCFLNLTDFSFMFDNIELRFGTHSQHDIEEGVIVMPIPRGSISVHPRYDAVQKTYDIAMIQLNRPLTFNSRIAPACLPEFFISTIAPGDTCYAIGWGRTNGHGPPNTHLKQLAVEVVNNSVCRRAYFYRRTEMVYCAGGIENEDTCLGDSGGPLLCRSPITNRWEVQGVISFGSRTCGKKNSPTLFMKVSFFRPWMEQVMEHACKD